MSRAPLLTNYVSEIDQFLQGYDQSHPAVSLSQQQEQVKHQRIHQLRDETVAAPLTKKNIWEGF